MKQLIIITTLMYLTFAAGAQSKNYNKDGRVKVVSDKTFLQIQPVDATVGSLKQSAGAILGALLPPTIDFFATSAKTISKNNVAKYLGQYSGFNSNSGFYDLETSVNLPKLTITRHIMIKGSSTSTQAAMLELTPELSQDQTAFRYKLTAITYAYSKAKTKGDWDYVDLTVELKFKSIGINKGQYDVKDLRGTNMFVPMVRVGDTYTLDANNPIYSGWIPFPPPAVSENEIEVISNEIKDVVTTKSIDDKPQPAEKSSETVKTKKKETKTATNYSGTGMYEIEATVVETNPYKIKAEQRQQLVENSSDKAAEILKALVGLTKKEEEKKEEEK